jgi:FKBP-type peptidyl-prolyl cis-trans isomerase FkpA
MPNIQINNLPLYTGDTTGTYIILNNSGETTTYKTTKEIFLDEIRTSNLGLNNLESKQGDSNGEVGQIAWDGEFIYVCVAPNTWKRSELTDIVTPTPTNTPTVTPTLTPGLSPTPTQTPTPSCVVATPESQLAVMTGFCVSNSIAYTISPNIILYEIISPGVGTKPNSMNRVSVTYTGKLMNNVTFDSSVNPITFQLSGVIQAWQLMLPLIAPGGRIKFVTPSYYAYGCQAVGSIPSNSPLFFDVSLMSVT